MSPKSFAPTLVCRCQHDGAQWALRGALWAQLGAARPRHCEWISGLERLTVQQSRVGGGSMAGQTPAQRNVARVFQQLLTLPH